MQPWPFSKVSKAKPETVIKLVGGLGNQLFGYASGKYLEQTRSHRVTFDMSHIHRGVSDHKVSLRDRRLTGNFVSEPKTGWTTQTIARASLRIRRRVFEAKGIGWDPLLDGVKYGTEVNGYFQTHKYFSALAEGTLSRDLLISREGSSHWLSSRIEEARARKPIVLHLRRGDYRKVSDYMGLVSHSYLLRGLRELGPDLANQPIWVFSDEDSEALKIASEIGDKAEAILPPAGSDPAESLVLMSYGEAHVLSNSTFGWWSAALSPSSKKTIVPEPWLRGAETPRDLFPKNWVKLDHQWHE